jgi:hypothetical protein
MSNKKTECFSRKVTHGLWILSIILLNLRVSIGTEDSVARLLAIWLGGVAFGPVFAVESIRRVSGVES